jgi:transmembrane sensor
MEYKDYELHDFLHNEYFVDWLLHPNVESSHFWQKWMAENPSKRLLVQQARELVSSVGYNKTDSLTDQEYSEILEHLLKTNQKANSRRIKLRSVYALRVYALRLAASISLVFLIYFLVQFSKEKVINKQAFREVTAETTLGQKKHVMLPDGTTVIVNAGSVLKYTIPFSSDERVVSLVGEAYFDVAHDKSKRFIIHSGDLETKVLGTTFNVRHYANESDISVAVTSGKVRVRSLGSEEYILMPNEIGIYKGENRTISISEFDSEELIGWTNGLLIFKNEKMSEVIKRLERWYGVKFLYEEGIELDGLYNGRYEHEPLSVLKGLSYTSHFEFEINKKQVKMFESD